MSFLDKLASLTPSARRIIEEKGTEHPFSGIYQTAESSGSFLCRRCGLALFRAEAQFTSGCGWPSFDEALTSHVHECLDLDGERTEIQCSRCHAHLGHVFSGEQYTFKNKRHCVNSLSLDFVTDKTINDTEEIILAGGCFWGVQHFLQQHSGVVLTEVGYTGGQEEHPTYHQICQGETKHYEAVRVLFNPTQTTCSAILKRFFEIHDPTQHHGQGPDIGYQYQSAVFCYDKHQRTCTEKRIEELTMNGYSVTTHIAPVSTFWPAEHEHQHYYEKHAKSPYCHQPVDRFNDHKKP